MSSNSNLTTSTVSNGTTDSKTEAQKFKNIGNELLKTTDFEGAIENYTKAIELNPTVEIYFSNRAQAHIKMENYGLAISDSTKSIELNPKYTKAYYRRAVANIAILNYKNAVKDLKIVLNRVPKDKNAKQSLDECQKIIRKKAFENAIKVDENISVFDTFNINSVIMEPNYDGSQLNFTTTEVKDEEGLIHKKTKVTMTPEFLNDMLERFKNGKKLTKKYAYAIVAATNEVFKKEASLVDISLPVNDKSKKLTICGDTHGQFFDLMNIFNKNGFPSENQAYLFNGDFVDRGSWSTEIAFTLYCYKLLYPNSLFINRGNHEADDMNKVYGFEGECSAKYTDKLFQMFSESFGSLPLGSIIGKQYLVLHGGLFSRDDVTLEELQKIDRFFPHNKHQPPKDGIVMEMLWTDPQTLPGRSASKRGVGIQFGPDVTEKFCKANKLKAVIRSHEVRMGGYEVEHNGRLITVFSAPNYCDSQGNKGAYINVENNDGDYKLNYNVFEAVPHPPMKPMAYAKPMGLW